MKLCLKSVVLQPSSNFKVPHENAAINKIFCHTVFLDIKKAYVHSKFHRHILQFRNL